MGVWKQLRIKMFLENEREGGGCVVRVRLAQTSTFASRSRATLGYCQLWYGSVQRRRAGRSPTRVPDNRPAGHLVPAKGPPSATVIFAFGGSNIWYFGDTTFRIYLSRNGSNITSVLSNQILQLKVSWRNEALQDYDYRFKSIFIRG